MEIERSDLEPIVDELVTFYDQLAFNALNKVATYIKSHPTPEVSIQAIGSEFEEEI